jgi:hypothetical protein
VLTGGPRWIPENTTPSGSSRFPVSRSVTLSLPVPAPPLLPDLPPHPSDPATSAHPVPVPLDWALQRGTAAAGLPLFLFFRAAQEVSMNGFSIWPNPSD